ncbi:C-type lectin domain family 10 member A-like [Loxodonta africana]|uniref:C-type lectin domain-containing protein n=1 Tax=Loxodonta africana TaxID=9785 RepID=G3UBC3_LOXAF|nr:C-type lectin domain family 10 member A-like isoform X2 [Loxodonta africana]
MSVKYEDIQPLESEEKSQRFRNGPRSPQSLLQRLWSGPHLHLLTLGLSLLLLVIICVIGSQISKLQWDLLTLRTTSLNFTSSTMAEVQALNSHSGSLQEMITSLRGEVEGHKQELQAARSLNDKVFTLESELDKQVQELKAGLFNMLLLVQQLANELKSVTCQMAAAKTNGSQNTYCPSDWVEHKDSCYWFSHSQKSWSEAEEYCQLSGAHLVVINSLEEQNFVQDNTCSLHHWIGLSDSEGVWKWVDGTDYDTNFKNWGENQPDDWDGHGLGGGEDCAHVRTNGQWNDDVCQTPFHWVCETSLGKAS